MNRQISNALPIAGLIIAAALGVRYLNTHGIIPGDQRELSTRASNLTASLILVWWTNLAPKRLRPLAEIGGDPATEQFVRRFASTVMVGGGLLSALDWLIAPFSLALPLEAAAIGGALIMIVFVRLFFAWTRR
jgi:hypothetical protein